MEETVTINLERYEKLKMASKNWDDTNKYLNALLKEAGAGTPSNPVGDLLAQKIGYALCIANGVPVIKK
jgi:hypothetical protein